MNIIIQSICYGVLFGLAQVWQLTFGLLLVPLPLLILAIILSMIFLFMEKCCGCCCLGVACCNISDQIRVYDPDQKEVEQEEAVEMKQVQVEMEKAVNMEQIQVEEEEE